MLTFATVQTDEAVRTYIARADETLQTLGYTEHSFPHVTKAAETAGYILETMGYAPHEVELARIAAFLHDIGNLINRVGHAQSGALMAFELLSRLSASPAEIAAVVTAIGNHDEATAEPVNAITAALILADKTDVRRSRVRNKDKSTFDIHDRVNYSVKRASVKVNEEKTLLKLKLQIDTRHSSIMDYFEIFLQRMLLCRRSAEALGLQFKLIVNEQQLV